MNIQKQNFLEQQLILKEIELKAHKSLNETQVPAGDKWNVSAEAVVAMEVIIMKREIDALRKENFPKGICNWCGTNLKDGNFVFASKSPFSYCNEGCMKLHEDMILKKAAQ
ncbi:MAG: hypothetical protein HRT35_02815 [Algicola sp.]|nr:hypothetical protein [Algicola sp.]